ncbi:MAG: type III pantothenate kinase [Planktotalea sp.]|jgi:type III pantothenate kinase|uniref:type III pantothenate kinase n=1 Tax=Planktotalea sp. TaxID=2029877 RepID=UPI000183B1AF|nr:type III pantothenate kinase [Planktotalea sp.]EDZ43358.1 type III pantothenate kinase [Rhodobacteraceae bacterium HTCC2083]MBT5821137.1 type III pantothenate kinase [Paracoccaceae bacterium]MDG1077233.1 type III pantothenate kinase [Planktotalea sp.]MDG1084988.1 type III pantothenate kinase [Planktotalea sp.]HCW82648.1 type III pantothenate kinase [Paracoccaceae bacterium]
MLLAIDCGNTNTVFSIWDGTTWLCTLRTSTHHGRTADAYFTWFSTLVKHYDIELDIKDVIISATVPRVVFNLRIFSDRFFNCRPLVVGKPECALPNAPRVDAGTKVGPDRLANAAGAYDRHGGNVVVVDFGTATNFDVVAEDGAYVGGVISPGVNLSLEALALGAAALPHVDISQPEHVIGVNTVECIQSGVFWGYTGLIEGITSRIKNEYGKPMKVVGTGGLAPLFASAENLFDVIEDDLTMHGLIVIHEHNKKNG